MLNGNLGRLSKYAKRSGSSKAYETGASIAIEFKL
jgi:hypothetical protein